MTQLARRLTRLEARSPDARPVVILAGPNDDPPDELGRLVVVIRKPAPFTMEQPPCAA